jgi:cytochrome P450
MVSSLARPAREEPMSEAAYLAAGDPSARDLFDFTLPEFRADPYARYRMLREKTPVLRAQRGPFRFTLLTRHADVVAVLRDPRMSVDRPFQPRPPPDDGVDPATLHPLARALRALSRVMLFRDPPDHTRLRGLVNKAFTPRMVESLRPRIESLVDALLAPHAAAGGLDVVRDFAEPLPILVIAELLGLPGSDRADLKRWSDELAVMLDGSIAMQHIGRAVQSAVEVIDYLRVHLEAKRRRPQDDLISAMLAAQERDERLSDDEILGTALIVMAAGHETTTNLIGNGALALLRHPGERARLHAEPARIEGAVEEILRFDSPVQATSRLPLEGVEICGERFEKGVEVGLLLGAANRDPAVFDDPDRFDVARTDNRHVSFGYGVHFCLGAGLARLEGQLAIGALVARAPAFALAMPDSELAWRPGWLLRGLMSLPIRFGS